jgi:hypothetical protein
MKINTTHATIAFNRLRHLMIAFIRLTLPDVCTLTKLPLSGESDVDQGVIATTLSDNDQVPHPIRGSYVAVKPAAPIITDTQSTDTCAGTKTSKSITIL